MNVTAIASSPQTSTGPPFERLYAVEPGGVAQMIPSQACRPSASPPTDQASSTIRPTVALAATTSFTATRRSPSSSTSSVGSSIDAIVAGEDARQRRIELVAGDRGQEADAPEVDADRRDAGAEQAPQRAQHRAVAAEDDDDIGVGEIVGVSDVVLRHLVRGRRA